MGRIPLRREGRFREDVKRFKGDGGDPVREVFGLFVLQGAAKGLPFIGRGEC